MYTLEGVSSVANSLLLMKSLNKTETFLICNAFFVSKGNLFDVFVLSLCLLCCEWTGYT